MNEKQRQKNELEYERWIKKKMEAEFIHLKYQAKQVGRQNI